MILVVLVQGGNQGGMGAAFGGGNSQGVFGAGGATSFLGKLTYGAAAVFMGTCIFLVILQGKTGDVGLSGKLTEQKQQESLLNKPAEKTEPAPQQENAPAEQPKNP